MFIVTKLKRVYVSPLFYNTKDLENNHSGPSPRPLCTDQVTDKVGMSPGRGCVWERDR